MHSSWACEQELGISFRTVIHDKRISIKRVPIIECSSCCRYEILPQVKQHLCSLLEEFKGQAGYINVEFTACNELAGLMYEWLQNADRSCESASYHDFQRTLEARIDHLLDVYQYAKVQGDQVWMDELKERLRQLSMATKSFNFTELCHKMILSNEKFS